MELKDYSCNRCCKARIDGHNRNRSSRSRYSRLNRASDCRRNRNRSRDDCDYNRSRNRYCFRGRPNRS